MKQIRYKIFKQQTKDVTSDAQRQTSLLVFHIINGKVAVELRIFYSVNYFFWLFNLIKIQIAFHRFIFEIARLQ